MSEVRRSTGLTRASALSGTLKKLALEPGVGDGVTRPNIRLFIAPGEPEPALFVCPTCDAMCPYQTEHADKTKMRFFRRTRCTCERVQQEKQDQARAVQRESDRKRSYEVRLKLATTGLKTPARLSRATFSTYQPVDAGQSVALELARNTAIHIAMHLNEKRGTLDLIPESVKKVSVTSSPPLGLLLYGDNGRGKSHLAMSICKLCVRCAVSCRFWNVTTLLDAMRREFSGTGEPAGTILRECIEVDVLVLDDFGKDGAGSGSEWGITQLYRLIDQRYEAKRPLIITTNRDRDTLARRLGEEHGPAIVSRLSTVPWMHVTGTDGREIERDDEE